MTSQTQTDASPDPALLPPPVLTEPGPEYADDRRMFQGIPGIERAGNGRLWALWYSGGTGEGPDNVVILVTSEDDGRTWSEPRLVIAPPGKVRAFDACLWHDPDGQLWLFWAQSISWFDGRGGVWAICCTDATAATPEWSAPRRLCPGVMMNKPTVLSTGEWLLPVALWDRGKEQYPALDAHRRASVVASTDHGATWKWRGGARIPAEQRCWDEHMVVERNDGTLWMLVRTCYGMGESVSVDRGKTWSEVEPSPLKHTSSRFFLRRLQSGNLLLVKHGPLQQQTGRSHLTAYLSRDDGQSWSGGLLLDERNQVSYPDGVLGPDGSIVLIYDYERTGAKQILMAVFTEVDVAAGKVVSAQARLRVTVNQATGAITDGVTHASNADD